MRPLLLLLLSLCGPLSAAPVTSLAFSPDGATLASIAGDTLSLHDPTSGAVRDSIRVEKTRLTSLAFAPGGSRLAVSGGIPGERGEVRLLDLETKTWMAVQPLGHDLAQGVAFSPDGALLAVAGMEKVVTVFRLGAKEPWLTQQSLLKGHSGPVTAVAFSPDGKLIVTTSLDRSLKVWSASNGSILRSLGQHTEAIHALTFRPMPRDTSSTLPTCVTGGDDRTVRVWQPTIGRMVRIVRHHNGSILALACSPDGRSIYSAGQEGIIRQIDSNSDSILRHWPASPEWIHSLAISPGGQTLASGDWKGTVSLHSISRDQERPK